MNSRQKYNLEILRILEKFILENPDIRFIQSLWCLNLINRKNEMNQFYEQEEPIEDRFYEESEETIKKVLKVYKQSNNN